MGVSSQRRLRVQQEETKKFCQLLLKWLIFERLLTVQTKVQFFIVCPL